MRPLWETPIDMDNTRLVQFLGKERTPRSTPRCRPPCVASVAYDGGQDQKEPWGSPSGCRPGADSGSGTLDRGSRGLEVGHDPSGGKDAGLYCAIAYQHFRDKQEILTQLAMEGQLSLAKELVRELPEASDDAVRLMVERYWTFMLENKQVYRLMNGMDGVPIEREKVGNVAQDSFEAAKAILRAWLIDEKAAAIDVDVLLEEVWAVLHGMAALYLDRSAHSISDAHRTALPVS